MWKSLSPVNSGNCINCPALLFCGGGCKFDAFNESGHITGLDVYRCEEYLEILEWLVWDLYDSMKTKIKNKFDVIIPLQEDRNKMILKGEKINGDNRVSWR